MPSSRSRPSTTWPRTPSSTPTRAASRSHWRSTAPNWPWTCVIPAAVSRRKNCTRSSSPSNEGTPTRPAPVSDWPSPAGQSRRREEGSRRKVPETAVATSRSVCRSPSPSRTTGGELPSTAAWAFGPNDVAANERPPACVRPGWTWPTPRASRTNEREGVTGPCAEATRCVLCGMKFEAFPVVPSRIEPWDRLSRRRRPACRCGPGESVCGQGGGKMANRIKRDNRELARGTGPEHRVDPFRVMDALLRWDPFRGDLMRGDRDFVPRFDVKETKDAYVIQADLPGVQDEELEVSLSGNLLTVSGRREEQHSDEGESYYAMERSYGDFVRSFTMPDGVDADGVSADLKQGVLTVRLPKKPDAQPKLISIGKESENKAKA